MTWSISDDKINKYLLDANHPIGASKARFFSRIGFSLGDIQTMKRALLNHPNTATLIDTKHNQWGVRVQYRCDILAPNGRKYCIITVWQDKLLVTAYPG